MSNIWKISLGFKRLDDLMRSGASFETVVAGGDGLQEVVGDKATALKETRAPDLADCCTK